MNTQRQQFDVIVVGGGAAGIVAAISAKRAGHRSASWRSRKAQNP
ncbi:MAG: FAD-binding protein, partial [Candidatus Omnitrophica bacterium]|nr:FAD-binding protein [Candidatus Omnitrophota bacterium]